jgi:hypothetical protein
MCSSPAIVPADRLDRDIYLVLEDFGAHAGCAWRETDEQDADRETVLRDILSGQYAYPLSNVASNTAEGWSRDVTEEIADMLAKHAAHESLDLPPALDASFEPTRPAQQTCNCGCHFERRRMQHGTPLPSLRERPTSCLPAVNRIRPQTIVIACNGSSPG